MSDMTARLRRRVERDFPDPGSAAEVERLVRGSADTERVQAALVLWANGSIPRLLDIARLAAVDWRDALVRAELAEEGWPDRLDAELGHDAGALDA
jgi:hypothetical protein